MKWPAGAFTTVLLVFRVQTLFQVENCERDTVIGILSVVY